VQRCGLDIPPPGRPCAGCATNLRGLAGYRHPRCLRPAVADALRDALTEPRPLLAAADAAGDRLAVLPVLYHLMWRHVIAADLAAAPLGPGTIISAADVDGTR